MAATSTPEAPVPTSESPSEGSVRHFLDVARNLAPLIALLAGILFIVLLALGVLQIVFRVGAGDLFGAIYCLVSAFVNYIIWRELPGLEQLAAARRYGQLRERLLVWVVLGILFFVVEGVILGFAWLKTDNLVRPAPATSAPVGAPPAWGSSPTVAAQSAAPPVCLRCGSAGTWVSEYRRYYCFRCSTYL